MPFPVALAAMMAMSAAKAKMDADKAKSKRKTEAEIHRYSPWTGMRGETVDDPNSMGTMMQGAMAGMQMQGQNPGMTWGGMDDGMGGVTAAQRAELEGVEGFTGPPSSAAPMDVQARMAAAQRQKSPWMYMS